MLESVAFVKLEVGFGTCKQKILESTLKERALFTNRFHGLSVLVVYTLIVVVGVLFAKLAEVLPTIDVSGAVVVANVAVIVEAKTGVGSEAAAAAVVAGAEEIGTIAMMGVSSTVIVIALAFVAARRGEADAGEGAKNFVALKEAA